MSDMYPLEIIKARCIPLNKVRDLCGVSVPQTIKWIKEGKIHEYEFTYPESGRSRVRSIDPEEVLKLKEEEGL